MITLSEKCRIDSVEVGELQVTVIGRDPTGPMMAVKYALANAESGLRFGAGHMNSDWSEKTTARLTDLLKSIEEDIARNVFSGVPPTGSTDTVVEPQADGVPSL